MRDDVPEDKLEDITIVDEAEVLAEKLLEVLELVGKVLPLELPPETELDAEVDAEDVSVTKVFVRDDAGDASDELVAEISLEVELDVSSVLVGRNTPLYVVERLDEDDNKHTSDDDEQQVTVVPVNELVEKTPPYPEGKQVELDERGFSPELRKTPSYETSVHDSDADDEVVPFPNGALDVGHGVQETIRGWKAKTPRYPPV
jgi:hypothetical protein